jgi:hypothetical protein
LSCRRGFDELQPTLGYSGGRGFAFACDLHGWEGEFDAILVESLFDHRIGLSPDDELLTRQGHHLRPDLDREITELVDPLHFQRLEDQRRKFGILILLNDAVSIYLGDATPCERFCRAMVPQVSGSRSLMARFK